jgi:DNA-binding transcriptional MerR regulator
VTQPSELAAVRRGSKSATAFRTIGEVAEDLELPPHVLRFWESKFPQLKPLKRGGGRRYYRPEDIVLLRQIRQCLYRDGYTIRGVQKLLREGGLRPGDGPAAVPDQPSSAPTLFPLAPVEPAPQAVVGPQPVAAPPRRGKSAARATLPEGLRKTLEEARQELLAARALLLDELGDDY